MPTLNPPEISAVDSERTLLGQVFLEGDRYEEVSALVGERHFSLDAHRRIMRAFEELASKGIAIDFITVSQHLRDKRELEAVGGLAYLLSLTELLPKHLALEDYSEAVLEKSRLRELHKLTAVAMDLVNGAVSSMEIAGSIQDALEVIIEDSGVSDNPLVEWHTKAALDAFHVELASEKELPGHSYGLPSLNEFTGGMHPGEVTVVGARSGVGKSSLMCQIAVENCSKGIAVDLFSLEMTREQILRRIWAIVSRVPLHKLRRPKLCNVVDVDRINQAAIEVSFWPLRIHDKSELHISQITALARLSIRRHRSQIVVVDYAQTVKANGKDDRSRVSEVSSTLTKMIKHTPAHLVLLSQLRKVDSKEYSNPPRVGDLRETGQLENDAHVVLLLHRAWDSEHESISSDAEILIPKQRGGDTGILHFNFNKMFAVFEEVQDVPYR